MTWFDFRATIGVPGTPEKLADSIDDTYQGEHGGAPTNGVDVEIAAMEDNSDIVVIGGKHVSAALATRQGRVLYPGRTIEVDNADFEEIWQDTNNVSDGVRVSYRGTPTQRGR